MINSPLQFGISISAAELAEQVEMAMIPRAVDGVWEVLYRDYGSEGGEKLCEFLEGRLGRLQRARARIALIDRQIKRYSLNLSAFEIAGALTSIESLYHEYEQALDKLVHGIHEQAAGGLQGAADRMVAVGRLNGLNSRVAEALGSNLLTLQRLLSSDYGQYFLRPFHEQQSSRDFVSYFYASKYCYARFFLAQVKAFLLLHLVQADPCSPFRIKDELRAFEILLGRQEVEMTRQLPQEVKALVQELALASQGGRDAIAVSFRSGLGDHGLRYGDDNGVHLSNVVQEWRLEPIEPLVFNPHNDHRFRVKHAVSGRILQLDGPDGAIGVKDYKDAKGGWKISWNVSHRVFNLQFKGEAKDRNNDLRLIARTGPNKAATEVRLSGKRVNHPYENEQQFLIEPYNQPFAERERLLVDEHLRPGGYLTSEAGAYTLHYRHDGSVELVKGRDGKVVWSAAAGHPVPPERLMLQPDGNFVAYDMQGSPYWASGKYFKDQQALYRRSVLRVRKDGRVEIRVPGQEIFWITPQP